MSFYSSRMNLSNLEKMLPRLHKPPKDHPKLQNELFCFKMSLYSTMSLLGPKIGLQDSWVNFPGSCESIYDSEVSRHGWPVQQQPPTPSSTHELQSSSPSPTGSSLSPTLLPIPTLSSPPFAPPPSKRTRKRCCELELLRQEDTNLHLCLLPLHGSPPLPWPPFRTSPPR